MKNRDIRFRAWQKEEGIMYGVKCLYDDGSAMLDGEVDYGADPKDIVLMEYTGQNDKNGTEIYEGDIVEYFNWCYASEYTNEETHLKADFNHTFPDGTPYIRYYKPLLGVVRWNEKAVTWEPLVDEPDDYNASSFLYMLACNDQHQDPYPDSYVRVIGNIYENQELVSEATQKVTNRDVDKETSNENANTGETGRKKATA
jgi:hypothetical protein